MKGLLRRIRAAGGDRSTVRYLGVVTDSTTSRGVRCQAKSESLMVIGTNSCRRSSTRRPAWASWRFGLPGTHLHSLSAGLSGGIGVAIRLGQARGEIETPKEARSRAGQARFQQIDGVDLLPKPKPTDFIGKDELSGLHSGIYQMTDSVSDEIFEEAIERPDDLTGAYCSNGLPAAGVPEAGPGRRDAPWVSPRQTVATGTASMNPARRVRRARARNL